MSDKIYGLIGRTLKHSYSVPIHRKLGNNAYALYELEPQAVADFVTSDSLGAINVTIPYKRDVMSCCDVISPTAKEIGSVNTVVRRADGRLYGYNTDAFGFGYMAKRAGIDFDGRKVLILGSGGSSLTAQAVARRNGAKEIIVVSRNGKNNYDNIQLHANAQIIVNTTPVGMYPNVNASPVQLNGFRCCEGVLDLIYNPERTGLLMQAESARIRHSDGLPMLVAQAKAAYELFFDCQIDDNRIESIIKELRFESENLVLIGMPGCGKSTVGKELQKLTGRRLVDLDEEIVKAAGKTIPEIFSALGEEEFRRLESEQADKFGKESGLILVTGGGVVTREINYEYLHRNGCIYQLERNINNLERDGRPLSQNSDLELLYKKRKGMYERFRDKIIDNNSTAEQAAAEIIMKAQG